MTKRRLTKISLVISGLLLFSTLTMSLAQTAPEAGPARGQYIEREETIKSVAIKGPIASSPRDPAWAKAIWIPVVLPKVYDQPDRPPVNEVRVVYVKSVHNGDSIFFYFRWADRTQDTKVDDVPRFADAIALQVPYDPNIQATPEDIHMGSQTNPVNILYWRGDLKEPQNVVAGGEGTVQRSPDKASQNLQLYRKWSRGVWRVILSRPMAGASDNQVTFTSGKVYPIAFSNWNGAKEERDGNKFCNESIWDKLIVE